MGFTNFPNGVTSFGVPLMGGFPAGGSVFFVDTVNGSDSNTGTEVSKAKKTLAAAYALTTANKNDIVYFIGGATQDVITTAITWSNSFTHLIGVVAPTQVGMRARVGTVTLMTPMITFSGNGCIIKNIQFANDGTNATGAAVCGYVTGARNYFENCQFMGRGALAVVDNSHRDLVINSSNGENLFYKCTIGNDTMDYGSAASYVLEFTASAQSARNQFIDCIFLGGGSSSAFFVLANTNSTTSFTLFKNCFFFNNILGSMDAMAYAFNLGGGNGYFILMDSLVWGTSAYENVESGLLVGRHAYAAATSDVGVLLTY